MYASRLEKLGIFTFEDFLYHLPSRYEDYSIVSKIGQAQVGETVTIQGQVLSIKNQYLRGGRIKTMQRATVVDETGKIELIWFNQPFLIRAFPQNSTVSVSGRVEFFSRSLAIKNPEYEILALNNVEQNAEQRGTIHTGRLIPVYPETKGVSSKWLRRQIYNVMEQHIDRLHEYLPQPIISKHNFMSLIEAIKKVHFPPDLDTAQKAHDRLAFDELFLMQLASQTRRSEWKAKQTIKPFKINAFQKEIDALIASLPFQLTKAQENAVHNLLADFSKTQPMNRLLQGDVGSGKTVVAAIAMYAVYLNGAQSVLMAPTEILAQQHYASISKILEPFGVRVDLRTGSTKGKAERVKGEGKKHILNPNPLTLTPDILIGTHAVLSDKITFENLAFVVIDEQQRFGVEQRGIIRQKGKNPHLLTMTATPIPRTVALTMYGDLDLSYLNEMPHGRKKIKTWLVPLIKREPAYDWIRKEIKTTDSQAFIICPFIEESESMQTIKAAAKEYERLKKEVYPDLKLGLLHGKLKAKEKESVLKDFKDKKFDILVATPVVEVGIDIPNATIIMIEAADRFGLAQLHQLRGRVGRGDKQSYCLLFTESTTEQVKNRLKSMETTHSGAELAELDLKLRGPGNMYGTAQHGVPKLKVASFSDTELLTRAKLVAEEVFPKLASYPILEEKVKNITLQKVSPD